ncbi:TetR/AcrR family transcriptional regulator [Nigerium massiliense]|uniref:TetR/AcrR family transcriptional regulator n=1 Tax=Nigerium massiliense TaxID=1522317 RepID=UPI000694CE6A|nr:TetR/AcrR family transcriptional regulator [Nigerium massiliense]
MDATRPLLLEHGLATSTRQIAAACGIAEGTIFRVFSSKEELIAEVVATEASAAPVVGRLQKLDGTDLAGLVEGIIRVLTARSRELRSLLALRHHPSIRGEGGCRRPPARETRIAETIEALLLPHADALSVPPRQAARAIEALSIGASFLSASTDTTEQTPADLAAILLTGFSKETPC